MKMIDTYKHNKAARRYNKSVKEQSATKVPYLVGGAMGAVSGAALTTAFEASSAHHTAQRAIGGAIGGAAGGALGAKSAYNMTQRLREIHSRQKGRELERRGYLKG